MNLSIKRDKLFLFASVFFLVSLAARQILFSGLMESLGNVIIGPFFALFFFLISADKKYKIGKLVVIVTYFSIALSASLFLGRDDFLKIFSESLSLLMFLVIIPSNKTCKKDIIIIFKVICLLGLLLIFGKLLVDINSSIVESYIFENKNSWAQTILFPFFLSFYLSRERKRMGYNLLALIYFIFLIFSLSKTAIIVSIIFILLFYTLSDSKLKAKLAVWSSIILLISVVIIFGKSINDYFDQGLIRAGGYSVLTNRDVLWKVAIDHVVESPIFGIGRGSKDKIINMSGVGMKVSEFHSFYIEVLAFGGFFSLIFYLLLFLTSFINGLRIKAYDLKLGLLIVCTSTSLFIYMLSESFYPFGFSYNNAISGYLIFSLPIMFLKGNIYDTELLRRN